MDFLKLLNTLSTIDTKTKLAEGKELSPWNPVSTQTSNMLKPWVAESEETKCNECGMMESKCCCDEGSDEIEEMMQLAGHPIKEAKKKKPDANKNGIPDYAEDGKGKMEEGKKVEEDDVEEGNAFSKAVRDAKKDGIQPGEKIEVGGKKYPVKETASTDLMKRWRGIFESEEKCADCGEVHKGDCAEEVTEAANKTVDEASTGNAFTAHKEPRQDTSTGKFDKKTTTTGTEYTRKSDTFINGTEDPRRPAKTMQSKKDKKPMGESMEDCMTGDDGSMDDNFSINSSMDSSGHKSVSITASGSKADELTNILRNAGLGVMGGSEHAEPDADDMGGPSDHDADNMGGGDVEVISIPLAQHDGYQAPEPEGEVDEAAPGWARHTAGAALGALTGIGGAVGGHMVAGPLGAVAGGAYMAKQGHDIGAAGADAMWDKFSSKKPNAPQGEVAEEYSNEPDTQVQPVSTQLRQGNDLNREKQQHKHSYRQGDNPMAMEDQQAAARLEKELMEELSALKVVSEKYMTELSSNTLSSYGKEAGKSNDKNLNKAAGHTKQATNLYAKGTASAVSKSFDHEDKANKLHKQVNKRAAGMDQAAGKLKKLMSKGMLEAKGSWNSLSDEEIVKPKRKG